MNLKAIDYQTAKRHVEKWHYSGLIPKGKNLFFGWYDGDAGLYAVANYGWGINPYQASFLARTTGEPVTYGTMLELKRLCRRDPQLDVYLTQFLSGCHKLLRRDGFRYIVSFSDPDYGHTGGIYKAANFQHLGKTNAEMHVVDQDGNRRHRRYAYRHAKRHDCTIAESRVLLGLTTVKTQPKDRWFLKI